MVGQKIIKEFFKEELQTSSGFSIYTDLFLYKDKLLLKENRLIEFAERQIDKAKKYFGRFHSVFLLPHFMLFGILLSLVKAGIG